MTNQWFRSWHGAPTDSKWLGISRKSGVPTGTVVAIVWALLDRASQSHERGTIGGYDADGLACFFGCEPEQVEAVIQAMIDKKILDNSLKFTGWEKHQPKREDGASERSKAWRERNRTQPNANERKRSLDTDTDTDIKLDSCPKRVRTTYPEDFEKFWSAYPTDPNMSKKQTAKAWAKISNEDRLKAIEAIKPYRDWMALQTNYRTLHAERFISQRRFDGFLEKAAGGPFKSNLEAIKFYVLPDTDEMSAWDQYWLATKGKHMPRDKNGGWYCSTQFPPKLENQNERNAA